jgi:hypothetical protein
VLVFINLAYGEAGQAYFLRCSNTAYFHQLSGVQLMGKMATNPSKSHSIMAKLKPILFAMLAFSFCTGTAQAGCSPSRDNPICEPSHCPSQKREFPMYELKSASIEVNPNPEIGGNVVSCHYEGTDGWKIVKSSDYVKGYLAITPHQSFKDRWNPSGDAQVCDQGSGCYFKADDSKGYPVDIFPNEISFSNLKNQQVDLSGINEVPAEYSCAPGKYKEILQKYDQCMKDSPTKRFQCETDKAMQLGSLKIVCSLQP